MENLIAIRDAAFWWIGNWALFTALDAAVVAAMLKLRDRKDTADCEAVVSAIADALRRANGSGKRAAVYDWASEADKIGTPDTEKAPDAKEAAQDGEKA